MRNLNNAQCKAECIKSNFEFILLPASGCTVFVNKLWTGK